MESRAPLLRSNASISIRAVMQVQVLLMCLTPIFALRAHVGFPEERLGKMQNVIVCYADWAQCDKKVGACLMQSVAKPCH